MASLEYVSIRLVIIIGLYLAGIIIYSLFFHPLKGYPGPFWARISKLWSRSANYYGLKYLKIHQAHQKYGSVVRVGPNELSFADPAAIQDIYTKETFVKENDFYFAKRGCEEEHLFSFRNPEAHKARRKLLARGYAQGALQDFEPEISTKIQNLLDRLSINSAGGKEVDIYPWAYLLSFDTVYHLLFGEDPGSVVDGQEHETLAYMRAWRPIFAYKEFLPQLESWGRYLPGNVGENFRKVKAWKEYSVALIKRSREKKMITPFFRSLLYGEKDNYLGRPLTDSEIAEECMSGMFGGTGTTANTFIYLVWATLQHPAVLQKLQRELRSAFPNPNVVPDHRSCLDLPYMQAVINETLRVYPTIVAMLPRTTTQDTIVAGVPIPRGTVVGTQNYTIHRWEPAFPNPEKFDPDRWLERDNLEQTKSAFSPFSVGSRRCIGINLAQMELRKLVAAFFRRFDVALGSDMRAEDMVLFDAFSAGPVGRKLVLQLSEHTD